MILLAEEWPAGVAKLRFKTCTAAARSKPPSRSEPKTGGSQQDGREAPPPKALPLGVIQWSDQTSAAAHFAARVRGRCRLPICEQEIVTASWSMVWFLM